MRMKDMESVERPREKLLKYGIDKLSTAELYSIILGSGTRKVSVYDMGKKVAGKIQADKKYSVRDIQTITGLGQTKALQIISCIELGKRLFGNKKTRLIMTPKDVWTELRGERESKKEHFIVFYLDVRNQTLKKETVSIGTLNTNIVHPREVFESAIKSSAAHIIISHNHPSGETTPSDEDLSVTKRLIQAGNILGIEILDHVIVTKDSFLSMKEKGIM